MFKKILIANRGEIACRIARTARAMGIGTVAVHSDVDADALHVRMADEALAIGGPRAYLAVDAIVDACRRTGAEAVHPGYGFLSEKPELARALAAAGIVFIGPGPEAIAAMGDKLESKRIAAAAGVSCVPGHGAALADADAAAAAARRLGLPVMLKASAGGGGKGMRIARTLAEVREGFGAATSEAASAFADGRVFLERYVDEPRHIEIQVLADAHGTVVSLGERECSIQRRHQKVVEEAPSPLLDAATRAAMGAQAVALARAVGYVSAGTVEFIVDRKKTFYFLEMNTRLQVEHPVTEAVTGLDLVEWMIRIAAGERLTFTQEDVRLDGWAMEVRTYAEDAARGFLPSTGRLVRYRPPPAGGFIRIDAGVDEGAEVTRHYDPMIAKVIAHGQSREEAAGALAAALDRFVIRGVRHNLDFLGAVLAHPRFRTGDISTAFIEEEFPGGHAPGAVEDPLRRRLAAVAALLHETIAERDRRTSGRIEGLYRRLPPDAGRRSAWSVAIGERLLQVVLEQRPGCAHGWTIHVDGEQVAVEGAWPIAAPVFEAVVDGLVMAVQVDRAGFAYTLRHGGAVVEARVTSPRAARYAGRMPARPRPDLSRFVLSPMPGLLMSLAVEVGQAVRAGEALAVVEAMKMENVLKAERDGVVAALHATPGDSLQVDQKILEFT
jgi:propionyl-CoA carboxylase alpha chain